MMQAERLLAIPEGMATNQNDSLLIQIENQIIDIARRNKKICISLIDYKNKYKTSADKINKIIDNINDTNPKINTILECICEMFSYRKNLLYDNSITFIDSCDIVMSQIFNHNSVKNIITSYDLSNDINIYYKKNTQKNQIMKLKIMLFYNSIQCLSNIFKYHDNNFLYRYISLLKIANIDNDKKFYNEYLDFMHNIFSLDFKRNNIYSDDEIFLIKYNIVGLCNDQDLYYDSLTDYVLRKILCKILGLFPMSNDQLFISLCSKVIDSKKDMYHGMNLIMLIANIISSNIYFSNDLYDNLLLMSDIIYVPNTSFIILTNISETLMAIFISNNLFLEKYNIDLRSIDNNFNTIFSDEIHNENDSFESIIIQHKKEQAKIIMKQNITKLQKRWQKRVMK